MPQINNSSMLASAEWSEPISFSNVVDEVEGAETTGTLTLTFKSGHTYTYQDVPRSVYQGLLAAQSPGSYYHQNIKGAYD